MTRILVSIEGRQQIREYDSRTEVAADLVNLVRFALKQKPQLEPRRAEVESRFALWLGERQRTGTEFRPDQLRWLEAIRDHIASSVAVEPEDLELDPFSGWGGLGRRPPPGSAAHLSSSIPAPSGANENPAWGCYHLVPSGDHC